ncbi:hypothetical protein [Piscinibacter gummiphilus]|uniref:Uncharacterized protein n=1 Tax=Piscinibacter gummiphilus TaxID=946333 RepID=A0A1W6L7T1_9BURK|nr:hypothetical protein [Piscinibacter gummiphilus]ARN20293.1 hypothetical protein A4W93_10480 [Piscinibacter gummiphilus]ATU64965.1 hypothetical protein CPZ87_10555 [Piscinibacter gummiphilus]GLS96399.1 hypothetical protein GCM10007918_36910 [Piscinibacter gummiphilus]
MHIITIAWLFVTVMMALAEATSPQGTVLGALFTFLLYGALPLSIVLYLMGTPARRRARKAAEAEADAAALAASAVDPGRRGHAAGDAVAAERKEP